MRTLILLAAVSATAAADPRPLELRAAVTVAHTSRQQDCYVLHAMVERLVRHRVSATLTT